MNTEIVEKTEDIEFIDPIGDLRRALNQEMIEREDFHKFYTKLKNLPMFFEIAKKRTEQ
jgi:hypothetical protein